MEQPRGSTSAPVSVVGIKRLEPATSANHSAHSTFQGSTPPAGLCVVDGGRRRSRAVRPSSVCAKVRITGTRTRARALAGNIAPTYQVDRRKPRYHWLAVIKTGIRLPQSSSCIRQTLVGRSESPRCRRCQRGRSKTGRRPCCSSQAPRSRQRRWGRPRLPCLRN